MGRLRRVPTDDFSAVTFPEWKRNATPVLIDWQMIFGNSNPVEIEVGFGKGLFLQTAAKIQLDRNFFGIEIDRKCYSIAASRLAKLNQSNVKVLRGDATSFIRDCVPNGSVSRFHVYFPDPWWKNRHHKRRIFTPSFVEICLQKLLMGGEILAVTDVENYYQGMLKIINERSDLDILPPPEANQPGHDFDYLTHFERKFRREGRPIYRVACRKKIREIQ